MHYMHSILHVSGFWVIDFCNCIFSYYTCFQMTLTKNVPLNLLTDRFVHIVSFFGQLTSFYLMSILFTLPYTLTATFDVSKLVGCFCVGLLGFVLPPLFCIQLSNQKKSLGIDSVLLCDAGILVLGVITTVITSSLTFRELMKA